MCQHLRANPLCAKVLTRSESTPGRVNIFAQSTICSRSRAPAPRAPGPRPPAPPPARRGRGPPPWPARVPTRSHAPGAPPGPAGHEAPTPPAPPSAHSGPRQRPTRRPRDTRRMVGPHGRTTTLAQPMDWAPVHRRRPRRLHPADKQPHFGPLCPVLPLILDTRICYNKGVGAFTPTHTPRR